MNTAGYHLVQRLAQYNAAKPGVVVPLYAKHYKNIKRAGFPVEDTGCGLFRVFIPDQYRDDNGYRYRRGWITTRIEEEEDYTKVNKQLKRLKL